MTCRRLSDSVQLPANDNSMLGKKNGKIELKKVYPKIILKWNFFIRNLTRESKKI